MCRVLGCVAARPVSLRHELLEADNPLVRQSELHDSGWGVAAYPRGEGEEPRCVRFHDAAHAGNGFAEATELEGRIFNAHLRRATVGGLAPENTHPFCLGSFSFSHNGTVERYRALTGPGIAPAGGDTDSEHVFHYLMSELDERDVPGSLRRVVTEVVGRSPLSGINFLLSDGERLYAYRLGLFELHWLVRPGQILVASERITRERWHSVQQDVLLVLDPDRPEPHAERLVGDEVTASARIRRFDDGADLRGAERGAFAARQAERLAAASE
jgi:predicted glutamine amidotransferase